MNQKEFNKICLEELMRMNGLWCSGDTYSVVKYGSGYRGLYHSNRFSKDELKEKQNSIGELTQVRFGIIPEINEGYFTYLSVYGPHRGKGFAREMVTAGQEAIKKTGISTVRLRGDVFDTSFWSHMGFEIDEDRFQEFLWVKRL